MSFLSNLKQFFLGNSNKSQVAENPIPEPKPKRKSSVSNRVTKQGQIRAHLLEHGSITSWESIQTYGATRLSAYIFTLRNNGYDIESVPLTELDRNNNTSKFVRYVLHQH